MNLGEKFKSVTGLSLAAFVALIVGLQWEAFFKALSGFPVLVKAWSSGLAMGFWSFLLALALGMGMWGLALMYAPTKAGRPHAFADSTALVVAMNVILLQQWGGSPGQLLNAIWLGLLAGLLSLYLARAAWAFFGAPKPVKPEKEPEP